MCFVHSSLFLSRPIHCITVYRKKHRPPAPVKLSIIVLKIIILKRVRKLKKKVFVQRQKMLFTNISISKWCCVQSHSINARIKKMIWTEDFQQIKQDSYCTMYNVHTSTFSLFDIIFFYVKLLHRSWQLCRHILDWWEVVIAARIGQYRCFSSRRSSPEWHLPPQTSPLWHSFPLLYGSLLYHDFPPRSPSP